MKLFLGSFLFCILLIQIKSFAFFSKVIRRDVKLQSKCLYSGCKQAEKTEKSNPLCMIAKSEFGMVDIDDVSIAYELSVGKVRPSVMYLPALDRPKHDLKTSIIKRFCQRQNRTYLSADWYGVGGSSGNIAEGTITRWTGDTITIIEALCPNEKMFLVGGGVGGWVALLIALERPDLVAGIIGLAADPDFTENLLWKQLSDEVKNEIMEKGICKVKWGMNNYPISRALIEDGRKNLLLEGPDGELDIHCPVRLVHGLRDEEVPISVPMKLAQRLATNDVQVIFQKSGTHQLTDMPDFPTITMALQSCIDSHIEIDLTTPASG